MDVKKNYITAITHLPSVVVTIANDFLGAYIGRPLISGMGNIKYFWEPFLAISILTT